jgi:hypothetical protein
MSDAESNASIIQEVKPRSLVGEHRNSIKDRPDDKNDSARYSSQLAYFS